MILAIDGLNERCGGGGGGGTLRKGISDLRFTDTNRVPFPFQKLVREKLNVATLALTSEGPNIVDLDGNRTLDISVGRGAA